jgi:RHS repeat-associated protein
MRNIGETGTRLERPDSDTENRLYYHRARYYDPTTGRFVSEDRLRFNSGDVNFYTYVGGDPTNAADPFGLCKVIVRYTKVWGWLPGYHAYVLTIDPSGQMTGIRGGPGENGNIATTNGAYDKNFPDFDPEVARNPEKGKCKKVLDDNKPCTIVNYLLKTAFDKVEASNIPYYTFGPNSNSVVPYALGFAGLPVPTPPVWAPGWARDPFYDPLGQGAFSANPTGMGGLPPH